MNNYDEHAHILENNIECRYYNKNLLLNNFQTNKKVVNTSSASIVDSVVVVETNGDKYRSSYVYDINNNWG